MCPHSMEHIGIYNIRWREKQRGRKRETEKVRETETERARKRETERDIFSFSHPMATMEKGMARILIQ